MDMSGTVTNDGDIGPAGEDHGVLYYTHVFFLNSQRVTVTCLSKCLHGDKFEGSEVMEKLRALVVMTGFPQPFQASAWIIPQVRPSVVPSTSFKIH